MIKGLICCCECLLHMRKEVLFFSYRVSYLRMRLLLGPVALDLERDEQHKCSTGICPSVLWFYSVVTLCRVVK